VVVKIGKLSDDRESIRRFGRIWIRIDEELRIDSGNTQKFYKYKINVYIKERAQRIKKFIFYMPST